MVVMYDTDLIAKDMLKLNNAINTSLISLNIILYLTIKYLWMFNMSDLSIALQST